MARIGRLLVEGEEAIYHVMSRTALDGFVLGNSEKDELIRIIKRLSSVYFAEVHGYCIMGNYFHLLVKMKTSDEYSDIEISKRFKLNYGKERKKEYKMGEVDRFKYRTRYFTDGAIIGSKSFVSEYYQKFKINFQSRKDKKPQTISGLEGVYSLKRLRNKLGSNPTYLQTIKEKGTGKQCFFNKHVICFLENNYILGISSKFPSCMKYKLTKTVEKKYLSSAYVHSCRAF